MKKKSLKRRQFLANLLFAGGLLSVGGLQEASAQKKDPKDEGWVLPKDLMDSPDPKPTETPHPPLPGKPIPPQPPGADKPPQLEGDVAPPTAGVPIPPEHQPKRR